MADYKNMSSGDLLGALGMDGRKWTDAFMQLHGDKIPDDDNMLGWFCNAIMAGYDNADRKLKELQDKVVEYLATEEVFANDGQPANYVRFDNANRELQALLSRTQVRAVGGSEGE